MQNRDMSQLPYLIKLMDDDSPQIRQTIMNKISQLGNEVLEEIEKQQLPISAKNYRQIEQLFTKRYPKPPSVEKQWLNVLRTTSSIERLAKFCQLIMLLQGDKQSLRVALEKICRLYSPNENNAVALAEYLFIKRKIQYASCDFDDPRRENLYHVTTQKLGSPLSLLVLYMLTAHMLDFEVKGGFLRGNFFACTEDDMIVEFHNLGNAVPLEKFCRENSIEKRDLIINIDTIILQLLDQLLTAYESKNNWEKRNQVLQLTNDYAMYLEQLNITAKKIVDSQVKFRIGQIVVHKKYGYRGVIVDLDLQSNKQTQDIYLGSQPWYRVLVHNSHQNTHIPQCNLMKDDQLKEVINPLVNYFFDGFHDGIYHRNNRLWKNE
ncbi:heat shock protein HspQ [Candidatus Uabimicrobium amorphum]|uniref:Heat shock protein HspQ n=1 Tax=Uabimicrobium amorphum TaxID=2596890 RepID=A0A5S9IIM7_UABAM|nr:heat shock protein HspQ [Candidatus Uabimicrobium amorphum]BBM82364.1 DNA-binding protein [Candidatus Uabimicrobium amorphum]